MSRRSNASEDGELDAARRTFERWRASRRRGTRIPGELWQSAVEQAREHGVSATAQALRLDYYSLQARVEADTTARAASPTMGGNFVEIPFRALAQGVGCMLEVEDGRGARLRLELARLAPGELADLVHAVSSLLR